MFTVTDASGFIPYGRQNIDHDDIEAVVEVLQSDWLTTGPKVAMFEHDVCNFVGVSHGIAVSSGTAALHCAVNAAGIKAGDEVIVSPITFAASANCVLYQGAKPVFADVTYDTLLISPEEIEKKITSKTKAIVVVDYAGHPCDYVSLRQICDTHGLPLIADCAHSLGATLHQQSSAKYADMATYSFHPVKHITSGEGGMVVTNNDEAEKKMRRFRNHGIDTDPMQRAKDSVWMYSMLELGYNYRISDFQCALASSQLTKLNHWILRRQEIAGMYGAAFGQRQEFELLKTMEGVNHAHHLYVLRLSRQFNSSHRQQLFDALRQKQIGVNVHYVPVYRHDYYQRNSIGSDAKCPNAEAAFERILSLPIYSIMTDTQVQRVIDEVLDSIEKL